MTPGQQLAAGLGALAGVALLAAGLGQVALDQPGLDAGQVPPSLDAGAAPISWPDSGPGAQVVSVAPGLATLTLDGGTAGASVGYFATGVAVLGVGALGLDAGAPTAVRLQICGSTPAQGLPSGLLPGLVVYASDSAAPCTPGSPQVQVFAEGWAAPDAGYPPWPCACRLAVGGPCIWTQALPDGGVLAQPAPPQTTLSAGSWSGPGCRPKTCIELEGFPSYPPECL